MMGMKGAMTRAAMTGLYHLGAHRLLAPYTQGAGVIFTLNQVRPVADKGFAPNRGLEVAPEFLDAMLDQVEEEGLDVVTLDEAARRLREDDERRFACFTFDQAYRDFARHAYPLFQRRKLPLTVYVATDYASGWGELWWLALEEVIARANAIELCRQGGLWRLPTVTIEEKQRAFEQIHEWLRSIDEARQRQVIRALADSYDIDMSAACHATRRCRTFWSSARRARPTTRQSSTRRWTRPWPTWWSGRRRRASTSATTASSSGWASRPTCRRACRASRASPSAAAGASSRSSRSW